LNTDERIIDLEIRLARQDDLLDALNQTVYRQQEKIDRLETLCAELARRLKDLAAGATPPETVDEKPPHY
jgi:SlyX protein